MERPISTISYLDLASRIRRSGAVTLRILRDFEVRGITVEDHDEWRLSAKGQVFFGDALRQLPLHEDAELRDVVRHLPADRR